MIADPRQSFLHRFAGFRSGKVAERFIDESRLRRIDNGRFGCSVTGWLHEQALDGNTLGETLAEKGFVGSVFKQPADQIGHPRNKLSEGCIDADAMSALLEKLGLLVTHAVEHLDFESLRRDLQLFCQRQSVSKAAEVMAGEGRPQPLSVVEQHSC